MPGINLKLADDFAAGYDKSVLENRWNGPEMVFNAVKEKLKPKSKILDLGIGTGESSVRFQQAGHSIIGLDGSKEMLLKCKEKAIGAELIQHDLEKTPFPFSNNQFDAVISNGVFHLIQPVYPVFSEVNRLLKPKELFAFTFEDDKEPNEYLQLEPGIWELKTKSGVLTYKYSEKYIAEILHRNHFEILHKSRFLAYKNKELGKDYYFTLIVAK